MFYKTTTFRLWLNLIVKSKNVSKLQFVNTERKIRLEQEIGARSQTPKIKPSIVNLQCVVYSFTCDLCDADYVGIHNPTPSSTHCRAQKSGNRSTFLIARLYTLEYPPPPRPQARQRYRAFIWEMRDLVKVDPSLLQILISPSLFLLLTFLGKYRQYLLKTYFFGSVLLWYLFWQKQTWIQLNSNWDNVSRNFSPNSCLDLSSFNAVSKHSGYCWFLKFTSSK